MEVNSQAGWHPLLLDPTGQRNRKPRTTGKTMVIDKGLGLNAFEDLLQTSSEHMDMIKIGFGTSPLYPQDLLQSKIKMAKAYDLCILPGGTFLEVAIRQGEVSSYFKMVRQLGFNGIEVSDGTIEIERSLRSQLILQGVDLGFTIFTEYGKKLNGSSIEVDVLAETIDTDTEMGAELITIEGRESGVGVGIYDVHGECKEDELQSILDRVSDKRHKIMWETPLKQQQVHLIKTLGAEINLGNIAPQDIMSVECLRRGLRSDTFNIGQVPSLSRR